MCVTREIWSKPILYAAEPSEAACCMSHIRSNVGVAPQSVNSRLETVGNISRERDLGVPCMVYKDSWIHNKHCGVRRYSVQPSSDLFHWASESTHFEPDLQHAISTFTLLTRSSEVHFDIEFLIGLIRGKLLLITISKSSAQTAHRYLFFGEAFLLRRRWKKRARVTTSF